MTDETGPQSAKADRGRGTADGRGGLCDRHFLSGSCHLPAPRCFQTDFWVRRLRRRTKPARPSSPEPNSTTKDGSGTVLAGPLSTKTTLSRPFTLSLPGSPLRNSSVTEGADATNGTVNCSQVSVVEFVLLLV